MNLILLMFILLPVAAAILSLIAGSVYKKLPDILSISSIAVLALSAAYLYLSRPVGSVLLFNLGGVPSPIGINLVLDGLSHMMLLLINGISFIVLVYSASYMERYTAKDKFHSLVMLMITGMNGAVLSGDLISLFLFLELASVASAALVAFGTEADETEASFKYLILGGVASMFILLAIAMIFGITGSLSLAVANNIPASVPLAKIFILILLMAGFGTKAAVAPFHAWLPDAHPSAPAPVSAMLSGVLVKALGVYALTRILYNVIGMSYPISMALMVLGALSIITGSFLAPGQWDMKRMMACSTVSQIGYIVLGVGLATPMGVMGGLLHLFNHSITKSLLFLTAGSVEYATGERDMRKLGGLRDAMPFTANSSLVGSLAVSGVPPFGSFWSKLFIVIACVQAGQLWFAAIAVIGSIITLSYFARLQKLSFFNKPAGDVSGVREVPLAMIVSMVTLALLCLLSGMFFTHVITDVINPAVVTIARGLMYSRSTGVF